MTVLNIMIFKDDYKTPTISVALICFRFVSAVDLRKGIEEALQSSGISLFLY